MPIISHAMLDQAGSTIAHLLTSLQRGVRRNGGEDIEFRGAASRPGLSYWQPEFD